MAASDRRRELGSKNQQPPSCCGKPMHWQPAGLCWHCQHCNRAQQLRPLFQVFDDEKK